MDPSPNESTMSEFKGIAPAREIESPEKLAIESDLFEDIDDRLLQPPEAEPTGFHEFVRRIEARINDSFTLLAEIAEKQQHRCEEEESTARLRRAYQTLADHFHEREVLQPIFLQLIAITDRCRQKVARLQSFLDKHGTKEKAAQASLVRFLLEARQADLVELENVLAQFGVEPFQHPEDTFDRAIQCCCEGVPVEQPSLVGGIARRLRPGYRRHGQVIRAECVALYVPSTATARDKEKPHARN